MTAVGSHSYRFFLELHRIDAGGRHRGVLTATRRLDHLPAPQPGMKEDFARFWSNAIHGVEVKNVTCEPVGAHEFIVRASISAEDSLPRELASAERAAIHTHIRKGEIPPLKLPVQATEYHIHLPPQQINLPQQQPPIVNVNVENDPLDAEVQFKRDPDGKLKSATVRESSD